MITNKSGLFGKEQTADPIGDIHEVGSAVDDILNSQDDSDTDSDTDPETNFGNQLVPNTVPVLILREYVRRVRLLTWAVGVIVLILLLKEVDS